MVPASSDEKVKEGVVSEVGVGIGVMREREGAKVSGIKGIFITLNSSSSSFNPPALLPMNVNVPVLVGVKLNVCVSPALKVRSCEPLNPAPL